MKGIYIALFCCFCKLLFQPSAPLLQSKPPPIFQTVHCIIIRGYVLIEKTKKTEQSEKKNVYYILLPEMWEQYIF